MHRLGLRRLAILTLATVALLAAGGAASAHSRLFLGFHFGVPLGYWGPPVYYYPPPVVYVPRPAYYYDLPPPPVCREYRGDATIDGSGRRFYGRACLLDDGRWHIVRID